MAAVISLVIRNYPGYADKTQRLPTGTLEQARAALLTAETTSDDAIDAAIRRYLAVFADGHLGLANDCDSVASPPTCLPTLRIDGELAWLRIPSFDASQRQPLQQLLAAHAQALEHSSDLVIDLRGNSGGNDDSYDALLPYVLCGSYSIADIAVYATPDNIASWEALLTWRPDLAPDLVAYIKSLVTLLRQHPGEMVSMSEEPSMTTTVTVTSHPSPERTWIIADRKVGSSAEQFLLAARQSARVTLLGEPSAGILDYGNVRPFPLPCGRRTLFMPTSRSSRIDQGAGIDGIGIPPDHPLSAAVLADDELLRQAVEQLTRNSHALDRTTHHN
ncbi:S41 family peptidase [Chitinolyticbacter albus]|uniref:S41 family peptidase n=1 Tax=Chitinolyticbacter albus TaxID=2961951 RepID=UPI00210B0EA0|nr:S41 family peptidase [Chitinolyticbacter albus]